MEDKIYQNLGTRAFWFFVIRRSQIFFILIFLTIALVIARNYFKDINFIAQYEDFFALAISAGLILSLASVFIAVLIAWLEYSRYKIMLAEDCLKVTRGVLTREELALPYRRIVSVHIKQPLLYQIFGVSRLIIEIITDNDPNEPPEKFTDYDDLVIPFINNDIAFAIQEELPKRANVQKMHLPEKI